MATQDVAITLKWDQARVTAMAIVPQADGSISLEAHGVTKDSTGKDVTLSVAILKVQPGQVPVIDNMLVRALIELRKTNGLEV